MTSLVGGPLPFWPAAATSIGLSLLDSLLSHIELAAKTTISLPVVFGLLPMVVKDRSHRIFS